MSNNRVIICRRFKYSGKETIIMKAEIEENKEGYLVFKDSGKPFHRWVYSKREPNENMEGKDVHHLDGLKKNNDKSNLILLNPNDHYLLHKHERYNQALGSVIVGLALFYIVAFLLNRKSPSQYISMDFARIAVFCIFVVALELRYGLIKKTFIKNYSEK